MESFVAGGVAGVLTRAISQPFDVVKIRHQLQTNGNKYKSIVQTFSLITKEERIGALWKGHMPAQLLSLTFGAVQFGTYDTLIKLSKNYQGNGTKYFLDFGCGAVAGSSATLASFPFDVIRTRLVAQTNRVVYKNTAHAFTCMYKSEGIASFYRGLLPNVMQIAPNAGAHFMFYKLFLNIFTYKGGRDWKFFDLSPNFIAGGLAGFLTKLITYPFDLVKKRLQVQGMPGYTPDHHNNKYGNLFDCVRKIWRFEGTKGFYKGVNAALVKAIVVTALNFGFYEWVFGAL